MTESAVRTLEILLVEDDPADARLAREALQEANLRNHLSIVEDGVQALEFLRRQGQFMSAPRPDLILLDLNLPRLRGEQVLAEIKSDPDLQPIPVVVLTGSVSEADLLGAYQQRANCYVTKPMHFEQFAEVIQVIALFWQYAVVLPPNPNPALAAGARRAA